MKDFLSICKLALLNKKSAALLTPEAEAAAVPPQDPNAMGEMPPQGGMPMDPAMMGGQPPMDPSMMGGMPPQGGAPMDPAMMQGAQMPQGQPGAWMQDPMFIQFLQQMGVQFDRQGNAIDPNGQPIPPEMLDQLYMSFQQQMTQQGGAPMDPSMMQGGIPQDPSMLGSQTSVDPNTGMPMDPAMMGSAPSAVGLGMPLDMLNNMASIIMDSVDSVIDEKMAALDKKISAFADKLDSIKSMLDDLALGTDTVSKKQLLDNDKLNAELEEDLRGAQQPIPQQLAGTLDLMKSASVTKDQVKVARSILDIMRG